MSIPTEYYQLEFIDFEDFMQVLGYTKESMAKNPHAGGDYMLEMFKCYEVLNRSHEGENMVEKIELRSKSEQMEGKGPKWQSASSP